MKKTILILTFLFTGIILFGQNIDEADKLVEEGVAYHDKGDFNAAISKYDKALELDKDNLRALTEKAYSLLSLQKYDEAIRYCQKAIEIHPGEKNLRTVYVVYGNATDALNKPDQSVEIYNEGIKQFPDYYYLHYNKGITLVGLKKYDEAILCFERSVLINPKHASSHNAIARLSHMSNKRIPSLLAYCRFLAVEQQSTRAKENLEGLQKIIKGNVQETGNKSVTINLSSDMLGDSSENGKKIENNFKSTDLILMLDAAMDYDKKNKDKTDVEQFIRKFETVCASLQETHKDNYGFFWDYYVPYFTEMKDKKLIKTFAYIAFSSSNNSDISAWLESNKTKVDEFFDWSDSFTWKTN